MQKFVLMQFGGHCSRVSPGVPLSFLRWLLCLFLFLACEAPEPDDRPLAQVGTELITERDYRSFVAGLPEWTKSTAEGSDQVRDYLQSLVDRALILRAAREQKVEQSAGVQKNMEVALRLKVGQAMEQRYIRPAVSVNEAELRREFTARGWERQLKIAHIFARTQARAEAALAAPASRPCLCGSSARVFAKPHHCGARRGKALLLQPHQCHTGRARFLVQPAQGRNIRDPPRSQGVRDFQDSRRAHGFL